jgi:hypothetical protein
MFLVALCVAGGYLYLSHADKRTHASAPHAQVPNTRRSELVRSKDLLNKQLSQMRLHRVPGHSPDQSNVQQQLNAIQSELDKIQTDEKTPAQSSQTTITIQARLVASIVFGLIGLIVIFAKRFPDDQKKYGFGMLATILAFWLKP